MEEDEGQKEKATVTISGDAYNGVRIRKAKISAKKGMTLRWDEFFEQLLNRITVTTLLLVIVAFSGCIEEETPR